MAFEQRWHPWRTLRTQHPDVEVSCRHRLPERIMGLQRGCRIWLNRTLTQAERRCTLTHELVHRERGVVPLVGAAAVREERIVDEISARRLITLPALADGLRWTRHPRELADHLWVDEPTLQTRMDTLDPIEVAELEHQLDGEWLWIP
ncbi:hypothetical protein QRB41_00655 [Mycobacterium avium subsp. hominissuis]|uniref:hypothetical protein n=1 Tax=Mycobacterium avium TaxID=1764 RepID=UPI000B4B05E9|nr:hypothetical protein [Mycobacterium avium]MBZ4500140.1 hypothetical protein [Mycobacterium avium subsp. hominissuis]MBZ4600320.1 hypothetical protein [Mycobacterium avium subsp. hominissuis]MDO2381925.1 hypothetical protein [Mycobacterium avium subsp. hominissuis]QBC86379.1 hypothetical protein B6K05_017850 [Mycobacterium avium subsp. hominissuis]